MGISSASSRTSSIYAAQQTPFDMAIRAQQDAFDREYELQDQMAGLLELEADYDAEQKRRKGEKVIAQNELTYANSGVLSTEGSPIDVLNQQRAELQDEVDALKARGKAQAIYTRRRAAAERDSGRSKLLGDIANFNTQRDQAAIYEAATKGGGKLELIGDLLQGVGGFVSNATRGLKKVPKAAPKAAPQAPAWQQSGLRGYLPQAGFAPPKIAGRP